MLSYKMYVIFIVFVLIQSAFTTAVDDSSDSFESSEEEIRKNPTPSQKLLLYTFDNFLILSQNFAANAANVSRYILKDESLVANTKPELMEFKQNLTMFVEKYDATKNGHLMWDILDIYTNTTSYYYELPQEKVTAENTFVLDILNKYHCKDVITKFTKEFDAFMNTFVKMFEENKSNLEKPLLDWYEKYSTLTDFQEKVDAFSEFLKLA